MARAYRKPIRDRGQAQVDLSAGALRPVSTAKDGRGWANNVAVVSNDWGGGNAAALAGLSHSIKGAMDAIASGIKAGLSKQEAEADRKQAVIEDTSGHKWGTLMGVNAREKIERGEIRSVAELDAYYLAAEEGVEDSSGRFHAAFGGVVKRDYDSLTKLIGDRNNALYNQRVEAGLGGMFEDMALHLDQPDVFVALDKEALRNAEQAGKSVEEYHGLMFGHFEKLATAAAVEGNVERVMQIVDHIDASGRAAVTKDGLGGWAVRRAGLINRANSAADASDQRAESKTKEEWKKTYNESVLAFLAGDEAQQQQWAAHWKANPDMLAALVGEEGAVSLFSLSDKVAKDRINSRAVNAQDARQQEAEAVNEYIVRALRGEEPPRAEVENDPRLRGEGMLKVFNLMDGLEAKEAQTKKPLVDSTVEAVLGSIGGTEGRFRFAGEAGDGYRAFIENAAWLAVGEVRRRDYPEGPEGDQQFDGALRAAGLKTVTAFLAGEPHTRYTPVGGDKPVGQLAITATTDLEYNQNPELYNRAIEQIAFVNGHPNVQAVEASQGKVKERLANAIVRQTVQTNAARTGGMMQSLVDWWSGLDHVDAELDRAAAAFESDRLIEPVDHLEVFKADRVHYNTPAKPPIP